MTVDRILQNSYDKVSMSAEFKNWNIVIAGAWNPAILTPDGIRKRIFGLPQGATIQIELAIDKPGSFRVIHDGIIVAPTSERVEVGMETCDAASLTKASEVAQKVLAELPETPVAAAGVNIRCALDPLPDEIIDLLKTPVDDVYSDEGYTIKGAVTKRLLAFPPGAVNVEISQDMEGGGFVLLNFHYDSASPESLREWLGKTGEFFEFAKELLAALKVPLTQE